LRLEQVASNKAREAIGGGIEREVSVAMTSSRIHGGAAEAFSRVTTQATFHLRERAIWREAAKRERQGLMMPAKSRGARTGVVEETSSTIRARLRSKQRFVERRTLSA